MDDVSSQLPGDYLERIKNLLVQKVKPGTYKGGGDHLGNIQLNINEITSIRNKEGGWRVHCKYEEVVETEFTIYPDNPPHVISHHSVFEVSAGGEIGEVS